MTPLEFDHVVYNFTLGKRNWDLRTWILLSNNDNRQQFRQIMPCVNYQSVEDVYSMYNINHLAPDGLLYHDKNYHLWLATKLENIEMVKTMISSGVTNYDECLKITENVEIMKLLLLNHIFTVKKLNKCLIWASLEHHNEICSMLISLGANDFNHCMFVASARANLETVEMMLEYGATNLNKCLREAAHHESNFNIVKLLVSKGATALNKSLINSLPEGGLEMIKFLLQAGANNYNEAMKDEVRYYGSKDVIELLLSYGADNYADCLIGTASKGHLEIVKLMIEKGASSINVAMSLAAINGHMEVVQYLLNKGCKKRSTAEERRKVINFINY